MANETKNQVVTVIEKTLRHMEHVAEGHQKGGVLLAGLSGIGKTAVTEQIACLLGMKAIIIEVPHIVEEHVINIPFIVFHPQSNTTQTFADKVPENDYRLVLAQSNLFTQLKSAERMSDEQYLQHIKESPKYVQSIFTALGGSANKIPDQIKRVRTKFKVILFLDEFYRQTSTRIRNILRGILNNKIGMHTIPADVYIMYASNIIDTGLEEITMQQQMQQINYRTPSKKDWFEWLIAKYVDDTELPLQKAVIAKFQKALKDEDISFNDLEAEVRTSPRRWEQIILYLNSSIPVHSQEEAQALITNIANNFIHYNTGKSSSLGKKVVEATCDVIKETSKIDVSPQDVLPETKWRGALEHAVEQQMKLGSRRKHIPVLSGAPGTGKTSQIFAVAAKYNLRPIDIDVSELNPDDVIGLPIPSSKEHNGEMAIRFSVPKLYQQIIKKIEEENTAYVEELRQKFGKNANAYIEQYKKQKWKYLIFFDEINRAEERTFNALRKVILEKNFGPAGDNSGRPLELPEGSIVVAAMNPEGGGTSELTHHFRDVIDVVPVKASWTDTKRWLEQKNYAGIPDEVKQVAMNVIQAFVHKFEDKTGKYDKEQAPFHINVGTELYVSPREYTDMYSTLIRELNSGIRPLLDDPEIKENQLRAYVDEMTGEAMEDALNFIFTKHQVDSEEFMSTLRKWIANLDPSVFGGLVSKKFRHVDTLANILAKYLDGKDLTDMPENVEVVNMNNSVNNAEFIDEFKNVVAEKIKDDASVKKYVLDENHPVITLSKNNALTVNSKEKTSLLANFVLALLYTLHIHEYSNDRVALVGKSLSSAASQVFNNLKGSGKITDDVRQEAAVNVATLRTQIQELVSSL